ncbi:MAG: SUMF1/EgtB/PvdO family nonheme iron enzyme [Candidatus Riflebacteria bacterium]|nr:SUMF1/EgtB/PvdO family nonheme iron enzyme [Candidatus Riflebacteria bacterium]
MGGSVDDPGAWDDEKPRHKVCIIQGFQLGRYPVTQEQWVAVMGDNPSSFTGCLHPVDTISWADTQQFLQKLNERQDGYHYRLPTEAEWEYAARAGTAGQYPGNLNAIAWYDTNSGNSTHPVGEKLSNPWGLYDMIGNVSEWCQDWFDADYYPKSPENDPQGPTSGTKRVRRGGSWGSLSVDCGVSRRYSGPVEARHFNFGFRCLREFPELCPKQFSSSTVTARQERCGDNMEPHQQDWVCAPEKPEMAYAFGGSREDRGPVSGAVGCSKRNQTFRYAFYGLVFQYPFPCPELPQSLGESSPDVIVAEGPVPRQLDAPTGIGYYWQSEPNRFLLFAGRRTGCFLVEAGNRVTIDRSRSATDSRILFFLLTKVLVAILLQRGHLVLHANAVLAPKGALVFFGNSGAGKSTTSAALSQRGFRILSDDITAFSKGDGNVTTVLPGIPRFYLTNDTAEKLQQPTDGMPPQRERRLKASIRFDYSISPVPLHALYLLQPGKGASVGCESLRGPAKISAFLQGLYDHGLKMERTQLFSLVTNLLAKTPMYCLTRPDDRWSMVEILDLVMGMNA